MNKYIKKFTTQLLDEVKYMFHKNVAYKTMLSVISHHLNKLPLEYTEQITTYLQTLLVRNKGIFNATLSQDVKLEYIACERLNNILADFLTDKLATYKGVGPKRLSQYPDNILHLIACNIGTKFLIDTLDESKNASDKEAYKKLLKKINSVLDSKENTTTSSV